MIVKSDIRYIGEGNARNVLDVYLPETEKYGTIIYFHGGGLVSGNREEGRNLV